jgi:predicted FMN-binding regulatory protein PaiB
MEIAIVIIIAAALVKIINALTGNRQSSPVTVMDARAERFEIEKEIVGLEIFIDEMEIAIKELDQSLSNPRSSEEQNRYVKELEEKLSRYKLARDQLRDKKWELHEAKKKVFREEMFETM